MIKQTYYCDVCGSTDQSEEYRQDFSNFARVTVTVNDGSIKNDPMIGEKSQQIIVCNNCKDDVLNNLRTHFDKI
jgi:hypothetical protein